MIPTSDDNTVPANVSLCRPFRISTSAVEYTGYFGGTTLVSALTGRHHLLSSRVFDSLWVSVYLDGVEDFSEWMTSAGEIYDCGNFIHCILEEKVPDVQSERQSQLFDLFYLVPSSIERDCNVPPSNVSPYYGGHKYGGSPFVFRNRLHVARQLDALEHLGYRLFLQLDYPGIDDAPLSGNWPFGSGYFYLFANLDDPFSTWKFLWEY